VWGAGVDVHAHPLRSDAQSLVALQYKTAEGRLEKRGDAGEVAGYGGEICCSRRILGV
jgi:hypothetical protein